jgi:putative Mg2+ transporter-C (MgtC) family protein
VDFLEQSLLTSMSFGDMSLRLVLAAVFGLVLGFEREALNKPAGLRTHMLVSLAAAAFTILGEEVAFSMRVPGASPDPIRIIEVVTAGAAFLGTATIIQARGRIQGITTGASVWLVAALGVACGTGSYALAAVACLIGFFILYPLRRLEERLGMNSGSRRSGESGRDQKPESGG